jgi:hypothetical protein
MRTPRGSPERAQRSRYLNASSAISLAIIDGAPPYMGPAYWGSPEGQNGFAQAHWG